MKTKVRINKATLTSLPDPIRQVIIRWRERYGKSTFRIEHVRAFYVAEDAWLTAFGPDLRSQKARVSGEFAGMGDMMPGQTCPLPVGCTVIEDLIFCGLPVLTIYHNPGELGGLLYEPVTQLETVK